MSAEKSKSPAEKSAEPKPAETRNKPPGSAPPTKPPAPAPLFRRIDWIACGLTALLVFVGYFLTLAPNLTLEDSGELAVGSFYAGVPHPPGYPLWTLYTWLFTVLVPVSNIAFRVALSSAVAGAACCGLLALVVSRGSSLLLEGIEEFKNIDRRWENLLCVVAGFVAGMLIGFNGYMWSQAIIVEVYPFSVLSLMLVLVSLLRWMYAPEQVRYLYWAFFWFGVCVTNHQTLIVAAMGIEIAICARQPKLGRDLFCWNSVLFIIGLLAMANGGLPSISGNPMLYKIFIVIGIGSIAACAWLTIVSGALLTEWKSSLIMGLLWVLGASFYFYMPVASMTNPPMNWGYPRIVEGFFHALSRGQYEATKPTSSLIMFIHQLDMLFDGAVEEFGLVYLLVALVPFFFFRRMHAREKAWVIGQSAIYLCLAVLLLILLSPSPDRQTRELNKVFFTASHVMISFGVGYGLALIGGLLLTHYERFRYWALLGGAVATSLQLYYLFKVFDETAYPILRYGAIIALAVTALFTLFILMARQRAPMAAVLAMFACIPASAVVSHWSNNEQRGHLFGYWFGHDMFTPPFPGPDGKLSYDKKLREEMMKKPGGNMVYPEMTRDAVLFGGTDPGRFCPTYMIFCESFIPPSKKMDTDPFFDRRDAYIITQNALADATYLMYIRAHYNRSAQIDPPFFQELLRPGSEKQRAMRTNLVARIANTLLDKPFTAIGARVEARRRAEGVYPRKEIYTPTLEDSQKCFEEYVADANRRLQLNQIKPGEDVKVSEGKIQVSGQVAVMAINGLLTKVIFDKNPDHEFFVEESFPLEWMYPYLTPFGVIMKINRQPLPELTEEICRRDHEFWSRYSERFIGNWITYDTPISNICAFAEKVYDRKDYEGFKGDPKFVRDDDAQKAFSKLRSALAGVYTWRINAAAGRPAEQQRMIREADFAYKQAFAFCPYSPEAVFRYTNLLLSLQRIDEATQIAKTFAALDPNNPNAHNLVDQLEEIKKQRAGAVQARSQIDQLRAAWQANPTNAQVAFNLFSGLLQTQQTNAAIQVLNSLVTGPNVDPNALLGAAQAYGMVQNVPGMEMAVTRLVSLQPTNAEAWYDLAAIQTLLGKNPQAVQSLGRAIQLSDARLTTSTTNNNLRAMAASDARFNSLRALPDFQVLIAPRK